MSRRPFELVTGWKNRFVAAGHPAFPQQGAPAEFVRAITRTRGTDGSKWWWRFTYTDPVSGQWLRMIVTRDDFRKHSGKPGRFKREAWRRLDSFYESYLCAKECSPAWSVPLAASNGATP